jgi:hypothetical protein
MSVLLALLTAIGAPLHLTRPVQTGRARVESLQIDPMQPLNP